MTCWSRIELLCIDVNLSRYWIVAIAIAIAPSSTLVCRPRHRVRRQPENLSLRSFLAALEHSFSKTKPLIPGGCDENSLWPAIALIYLTRPLTITPLYLLLWRILNTTKIPPRFCLCHRNTLDSNQTAPKRAPTQIQMSRGRLQDGEIKARVIAGIGINPINTLYHTSNPRTLHRAQGRQVQHMRITKAQGKVQRMIMILQFRQIYRCHGDLCPLWRRGLRALRRFKKQSSNKALGRSMKRRRHQRSRHLHLIQITVRKPIE